MTRLITITFCTAIIALPLRGQFLDDFRAGALKRDPAGLRGWSYITGDGNAAMDFRQETGHASIYVDARHDQQNIWWALVKHRLSAEMDLRRLRLSHYALRIESRIRVSHAPKRINLSLNTQRTTNFHNDLMEFDIPDTVNWHTVSLTIPNFDAVPGDTVYGQLALMDWGSGVYRVDLQYFRADIVNTDSAGPDKGAQVPYHPPIPDPASRAFHIPAAADATIDLRYPDLSFGSWSAVEPSDTVRLLTASATQFVLMRWNLRQWKGRQADGAGLLELTTYSLQRSPEYRKDFGMVRVCEILSGDSAWDEQTVTCNSFSRGKKLEEVINSQMIIDAEVDGRRGAKNLITISRPVMQRLLEGKTLGLAIEPLGAVNAAFFSRENRGKGSAPVLHFSVNP